ncbi:phage tail sheath family protein [Chryseobacterium sp. SN22]|uniref:phage tail sheath family protein n=1 Tax=Chryseobacterium sp. SN22 TaxID=2606431 RepID=UPI0011EC78EA|nr:phage tail sheath C-terminal domain-containing protein [Chryseobacterium sp. SN22]KAA0129346.1 phage tail sheath family protein [Chryseobacterium sp. SN22]
MNYKTPGVYVEEITKLPPSVAQVETAIPAFIGYTEKGPKNEPTRITSLLEYEALFGKAKNEVFSVSIDDTVVTVNSTISPFKMYYAMQMYFANGGGPCYIVSANTFTSAGANNSVVNNTVKIEELNDGLATLEKEDEPTLIIFPDAETLSTADACAVYGNALDQAEMMKDRFVIMDVSGNSSTPVTDFRSKLGAGTSGKRLKYGAAYYPKLETVLSYSFKDKDVKVNLLKEKDASGAVVTVPLNQGEDDLEWLKSKKSGAYNLARKAIESKAVVLAPSSSIAGVYAKVDSTSGVFKAPANVGLNYVVEPVEKLSPDDLDNLNVDAASGKSINAIRTFAGKGTMVWGARTLDGNSNEWRYVSVRRFFNMVEESVKKATERFVFEANTANTWVKVQAMIENFLNEQWKDGALAGSKPEEAYYVSVGLNKTMSAQDILEGRMIIEVGMAAVRPAEFIVIRFSHKLQEA